MKEKKLRSWEHLEDRTCLVCPKYFVAKIYICQAGICKGDWIISSVYCSTKCSQKGRKLIREADD